MKVYRQATVMVLAALLVGGCTATRPPPAVAPPISSSRVLSPEQTAGYMLSLRQALAVAVEAASAGSDARLSWLPHNALLLRVDSDSMFRAAEPSLHQEGRTLLQGLANSLGDHPATIIHVLVYTDATGRTFFNQQLSNHRATVISAYLNAFGVPVSRIWAAGRGGAQPVASNETAVGRRRNRRVDIVIEPLIQGEEGLAYRVPQEPLP